IFALQEAEATSGQVDALVPLARLLGASQSTLDKGPSPITKRLGLRRVRADLVMLGIFVDHPVDEDFISATDRLANRLKFDQRIDQGPHRHRMAPRRLLALDITRSEAFRHLTFELADLNGVENHDWIVV